MKSYGEKTGEALDGGVEKKVTIDEVARLCGVSKTTVSRFLNRRYENISEATRLRIESVIDELGYRPNRSAQRLKAARSMLLGCCMGDLSAPFSGLLLRGITGVCGAAGYQVLFADSGEDARRERAAIEGFLQNAVDGLIVNTTGGNDEFLLSLAARGVPVALADRTLRLDGQLDTVVNRHESAIRESLRLMLARGYTRLAFCTELMREVTPRLRRRDSYLTAMAELAPELPPLLREFDRRDAAACRAVIEGLRVPGERTAILAVNGATGQALLLAMKALGLRPGRDLGFCTFDDWTAFQLADVTAIRLQSEAVGAAAARLLLERIAGGADAPRCLALETELIIRSSICPPEG